MDGRQGGLRARVRHWVAERRVRHWWQAGVAVILAITGLFGGLDTVDPAVTAFAPGEEFDDGGFTVAVDRARVVPELRAGTRLVAPAVPGRRYLGVVATVRNDGTIPWSLARELDLRDQPGSEFFAAVDPADGTRVISLGPGLQQQLAFLWQIPEGALSAGDSVTLRVWRKQFTQGMVTYGEQWVDSRTEYGQVVVPVRGPA